MTHRTALLSNFEDYLKFILGDGSIEAQGYRATEIEERRLRLEHFPYSVVLELAVPEASFADRWCWQQFGPAQGRCGVFYVEYPFCEIQGPHEHEGQWLSWWLAKTDYDFGYNEWCFANPAHLERFLVFVPQINWGEHFPK